MRLPFLAAATLAILVATTARFSTQFGSFCWTPQQLQLLDFAEQLVE
jgi:hypothetical protein